MKKCPFNNFKDCVGIECVAYKIRHATLQDEMNLSSGNSRSLASMMDNPMRVSVCEAFHTIIKTDI